MKEIRLNKEQFNQFNDSDQFQLFCDEDGFPNYKDFDAEVNKLYEKYDNILITEGDYIYGVKNGKREELSDQATQAYQIALEVTEI